MVFCRTCACLGMSLGIVFLSLGGLSQTGLAADEEPPTWQTELTEEIAGAHDCEVSFITHIVERTIGDQMVVMAKAHCEDRRSFDAFRHGATTFTFSECTQQDAQSC